MRFGYVTAELERLRADLETFRSPGGRFTYHDGERHWARMDDLDRRLREQEVRPPRLNPALDGVAKDVAEIESRLAVLTEKLRHIEAEQERLCQRLQACKGRQ